MDNNPWSGLTKLSALDQKLYQKPKTNPAVAKETTDSKAPADKEAGKEQRVVAENATEQELRLTLPLPISYIAYLDQLERKIFATRDIKHRSKKRITKNNVLRCWISLLQELEINLDNVTDDTDLLKRLRDAMAKRTR